MTEATILIVPGLRDHVEAHWQTHLEKELPGARSVPPLTEDKLSRAARIEALQREVAAIAGPIILVAHSAGAIIVAHWAEKYSANIAGAFLATPSDLEMPLPAGYPDHEAIKAAGWLPLPRKALPFRTIVGASSNDPLGAHERIAQLAADWGAELAELGEVGHLNPAAGYGRWPQAHNFIAELRNS